MRPRGPLLAAMVMVAVVSLLNSALWLRWGWHLSDMDAYWQAGERLRAGEPLYVTLFGNPDAASNYRYAPWFAWAWVPLTQLPRAVVEVGWVGVLVAASAVAWLPLLVAGTAGRLLAVLLAPAFVMAMGTGNVQPLLVAVVLGLHSRPGPIGVALAASLKGLPISFVLGYLARREWLRAGVTVGLTALLVAPILLFDLSAYPGTTDRALLPVWVWPMIGGVAWVAARRFDPVLIASIVAITLGPLHLYDLTWLAIPAVSRNLEVVDEHAKLGGRARS